MSYKFASEIRVRLPETDVLGVVYHGCFFTYFDVARFDYLRNLGLLEQFRTGESLNLIVHTSADFRSPARFDDVILVHTRILKIGDSSVTFDFRVDLKADGRLVAEGNSVHSFIDSKTWKPNRVPEYFRKAIREYEGPNLSENKE